MLTLEKKIEYFKKYLLLESDCMKDELYLYFFELENGQFDFLNNLNTYADIENKTKFIISKMFMHEHEDGLFDIIENYLL
jgi:hypothetical protein